MGHRLSKLKRSDRPQCRFCSSTPPPSYKETEKHEKTPVQQHEKTPVEKIERSSVNQTKYPTDFVFTLEPDVDRLFDLGMPKIQRAAADLESARRILVAIHHKDVRALYDAFADASFVQDLKSISGCRVGFLPVDSSDNLELSVQLEYSNEYCKQLVLTRHWPDEVSKLDESDSEEPGSTCAPRSTCCVS